MRLENISTFHNGAEFIPVYQTEIDHLPRKKNIQLPDAKNLMSIIGSNYVLNGSDTRLVYYCDTSQR